MDARKASCAAPISMGRGEIPVELCQQQMCIRDRGHSMQEKTAAGKTGTSNKSLDEKTTYRFGNRSFVVEPVFRKESPDTLGSILLRLMKAESEAK